MSRVDGWRVRRCGLLAGVERKKHGGDEFDA